MFKSIVLLNACFIVVSALSACSGGEADRFQIIKNGDYKVVIRSAEPLHSGIHNIDICVLDVTDMQFPPRHSGEQCFLQGYDLDGLTVKWLAPRYISVDIKDGWVSEFKNNAVVSPKNATGAVAFHISLYDRSSHPQGSEQLNDASGSALQRNSD